MKNLGIQIRIATIICVTLIMISCKENNTSEKGEKQEQSEMSHDNHAEHKHEKATKAEFKNEQIAEAFQHYIHIKTAFVNTNGKEAKSGAEMLNKITDDEILKTALQTIIDNDDIEVQRKAFVVVTAQMETMLSGALASGEVYKQFCPMAFNNEGGYWLSTEKEIRNPYFGDRMLKCGSVAETIK